MSRKIAMHRLWLLTRKHIRADLHLLVLLVVILLLAACSGTSPTATPTATDTPTAVPTATDTPTLAPSDTPEPSATPTETETPIPIEVDQLAGEDVPPPLTIDLPAGWKQGTDSMTIADIDGALRTIPVAVYTGSVTGGTGYIILFWGFPNLVSATADPTDIDTIMWTEGLRLFRSSLVEAGCNPGTDLQASFPVGDHIGSGARFVIVGCPESPDASGWFVGLREYGGNFVFFVYVEPDGDINAPETIAAINTAETELQAVMDTIRFHQPVSPAATPQPESTAEPGGG
jgi:hypothetical protein